ncbi:MAG: DUF255 domain-containing protein, partial [Candidatus Zixiibacteriota bacterium]
MRIKIERPLAAILPVLLCAVAIAFADDTNDNPKKKTTDKTNHDSIDWMRYDEGLKKAKKEDKHVFIDFTAKWCGWCKKMDRETFSKHEVIAMINENFVPVKVDGDSRRELDIDGYKISERDLTRHVFKVRGFPAFWFLKPDGSKVGMIPGYRKADFMMEAFEYVKDNKYDTTETESSEGKEKS